MFTCYFVYSNSCNIVLIHIFYVHKSLKRKAELFILKNTLCLCFSCVSWFDAKCIHLK